MNLCILFHTQYEYKDRGSCQSAEMARLQQMNVGKISNQQRRAVSLPVSRRASPSRSVHHSHQAYSSYSSSLKPRKQARQPSQNQKPIEKNTKNQKNLNWRHQPRYPRGARLVSQIQVFLYFFVFFVIFNGFLVFGRAGWLASADGWQAVSDRLVGWFTC